MVEAPLKCSRWLYSYIHSRPIGQTYDLDDLRSPTSVLCVEMEMAGSERMHSLHLFAIQVMALYADP